MSDFQAIRQAAIELIDSHAQEPLWNIRERDRQMVLAQRLRQLLGDESGVRVTNVFGGSKTKFAVPPVDSGLMTSRVHTETKLSADLSRGGHPSEKYDIVMLHKGSVSLKRDGYGPCNAELVVHAEEVAAIIELKSESLEFRSSSGGGKHGGQADFDKLLTTAGWYNRHGIKVPMMVQIVIDTGIPVRDLRWRHDDWRETRKPGWKWPLAGNDAGVHCPPHTRLHCWTLGTDLKPLEWSWTCEDGWCAVPA